MTKTDIIKDFLKKAVLPVVVALFLYSIFSRIFISLSGREIIFRYNSSFSISSTHAKRGSLWKEYLSHAESALENFFNRADIDSPCSVPSSQELSERGCVRWNSVLFFLNTFRSNA